MTNNEKISSTDQSLELNDVLNLIMKKSEDSIIELEVSVFSVYSRPDNNNVKLEQIGTAFLYKNGVDYYLITAHHVMEAASKNGEIIIINKEGKCFRLEEIRCKSSKAMFCDKNDFHLIKVGGSIEAVSPIICSPTIEQIVPDPCIAFGFPNSKNKRKVNIMEKNGSITGLRLGVYNYDSKNQNIVDYRPIPSDFHFLKWMERKSLDRNGEKCNSIGIRGMSGAPCFYVPIDSNNLMSDSNLIVQLAGMIIEYNGNVIKFVRFEKILSLVP